MGESDTNEQIGRLLSQRSRAEGALQESGRRAEYFGRSGPDFDKAARDGNRTAADRSAQEIRQIDAKLAQRGVTNIEQEKKDYVSKTGRHKIR